MAPTHFKEHAVWINLLSVQEFKLLAELFKDTFEKRRCLSWDVDFEKTKWIDDPKLGHRLHVVIKRGNDDRYPYLYGANYREWERIKRKIYSERRKHKNT